MTPATTLYVVDDHALFREGLVRLLEAEPGFQVCGRAGCVREALEQIPRLQPTLVLLDVDLGPERGLDLLEQLPRTQGAPRVLVVTAGVTHREAVRYIQSGAAGIIHKNKSPEALCSIIRNIASGDVYLEPEYLRPLFETVDGTQPERPALSPREVRVLRCLLQGMANKEIAEDMQLAESTVKAILRALFEKLNVRTRSQLVRIALEQYRDAL